MKQHKLTILSTFLLSGLLLVGCGVNQASSEHHSKRVRTEKVKTHHKHSINKHKKHDDKNKRHDKQADQKNQAKSNSQQAQQPVNKQPQPVKIAGGSRYSDVNWNSNGPYGVNARTYYANGRIHSTDPWIDSQYVDAIRWGDMNPDGTDTPKGQQIDQKVDNEANNDDGY